jgi:hypothetical protein
MLLLLLLIIAWMIIAVAAPTTATSAIIAVVDYVILLTALISVLPAGENMDRMNNPGRRRFIRLISGFPAAAAAYSSQLVV